MCWAKSATPKADYPKPSGTGKKPSRSRLIMRKSGKILLLPTNILIYNPKRSPPINRSSDCCLIIPAPTGCWAWLSSITDCCRLPIIVSNVHWPWPRTIRKINGNISSSAPWPEISLKLGRSTSAVSSYPGAPRQSMISHNLAGRAKNWLAKLYCSMPSKAMAIPFR